MTRYVLDTDHLSLLRRGEPSVVSRVAAVAPSDIAITIITVEEQFRGWFTQVRKARDAARLARAYEGLHDVIEMAKAVTVLPFSQAAVDRYATLKKSVRVGKQDLAIAAIVLEYGAVLVTRNRQDFIQVPNLTMEDWSAGTGGPV